MGFSRQEYWSRVPLPSPNLELPIIIIAVFLESPTEEIGENRCAHESLRGDEEEVARIHRRTVQKMFLMTQITSLALTYS